MHVIRMRHFMVTAFGMMAFSHCMDQIEYFPICFPDRLLMW